MKHPGALAAVATCVALAQPPDAAELRSRLSEVQTRLSQADSQLEALKKRRKGILVELQQIGLQAEKARAMADGARTRHLQTLQEVAQLRLRSEEIQKELEGLRVHLRRQIRWMQAEGTYGFLGLLASVKDYEAFLIHDRYLAWYRNRQRQRLERARTLQTELTAKQTALTGALGRLQEEALEAEQRRENLRHHEARLETFLMDLQKDEGRQAQVQRELSEEALQLERMLADLLGKPKPAEKFAPAASFSTRRGQLPSPVPGRLALGFGETLHPRFKTRTFHSGLLIEAESGTPVTAVAEGKVIYAEPFQTFGPMVILDHGEGWYTLYAHLQSIQVAKGQVLREGDSVGRVGETLDGPRLSFEVRQGAKPLDPQGWLRQPYSQAHQ